MSKGQQIVWMAKSIAGTALSRLSPMSGTIDIPSSLKSSTRPQSSGGISTSKSFACRIELIPLVNLVPRGDVCEAILIPLGPTVDSVRYHLLSQYIVLK
jgi:hypothetical protein